jgi:NADH dehydrogenase
VVLSDGEVAYDYLIIATGATHSHFGHDDIADRAASAKHCQSPMARTGASR